MKTCANLTLKELKQVYYSHIYSAFLYLFQVFNLSVFLTSYLQHLLVRDLAVSSFNSETKKENNICMSVVIIAFVSPYAA